MTMIIMDILDVLMNAPSDDPAWGLRLCQQTGHGSGSIYPALERMLNAGWIEGHWEEPEPADRPPRRLYVITSDGRAAYQKEVAARAARRMTWIDPALRAEGSV
jgi:PadR family transcriptional regulator, regulatory protein PadR